MRTHPNTLASDFDSDFESDFESTLVLVFTGLTGDITVVVAGLGDAPDAPSFSGVSAGCILRPAHVIQETNQK
jgi:hypothetical protein